MKVLHVVGARPNFMKVAPIIEEMERRTGHFEQILVHTGQHYDEKLSLIFFRELGLPRPDIDLGVGSGSHAEQTAKVMVAFEPLLIQQRPDLVLVVGDVNSTLACALVAAKLGVPVTHVEAGLRSFDRTMPEEINRVLTDQLADLLFTTEREASENLLREGIAEGKIHFVGNVMIDTLLRHRERALQLNVLDQYGLEHGRGQDSRPYALLTLHRPSNVDVPDVLAGILDALAEIQTRVPIIFPAHPRTVKQVREFGLQQQLAAMPGLRVIEPLGYLEFLNLMANACVVLTDSGGIQEETTILGIPCLTLRENTERPVTVTQGTNRIVGNEPEHIVNEALRVLNGKTKIGRAPEGWDGQAAKRLVEIVDRMGTP